MKVEVRVFQNPGDSSYIVQTVIEDGDVQVGEFFLPGGQNLSEAEALAHSIIELVETGYDLRKLMPDSL